MYGSCIFCQSCIFDLEIDSAPLTRMAPARTGSRDRRRLLRDAAVLGRAPVDLDRVSPSCDRVAKILGRTSEDDIIIPITT